MQDCSIDHRPFVVSSSPREIPNHAEDQNCSCYQYRVIHIGGIDRHFRRPEAKEQNDEHIDDGKEIDNRT